jgi:hypothetical protein
MNKNIVVGQDPTPDWFKKYSGIMSEINRQVAIGVVTPGNGLTLEQLQMVVEHRNPFEILRTLKHLQLLFPNISITTKAFSSKEFLHSKLGVKVYLGDNFKNQIVPELSGTIHSFTANLTSYKLTKDMYDKEIQAEIGEDYFTPSEALAIIFTLISKQSNGDVGYLENDGNANIFYILMKDKRVVPVRVHLGSSSPCVWFLEFERLDSRDWFTGLRVFARRKYNP